MNWVLSRIAIATFMLCGSTEVVRLCVWGRIESRPNIFDGVDMFVVEGNHLSKQ